MPNDDLDYSSKMTISHRLPCGCVLEQACTTEASSDGWFSFLAEILKYWVDSRTKTHVCALVSPENPAGNSRQAAREALKKEACHAD